MAILHSLSHRSRSLRCFQVLHEQRRLTRCGNDGRVVCVESELELVGRRKHVIYIQVEEDG
jgi:hypothetical protein